MCQVSLVVKFINVFSILLNFVLNISKTESEYDQEIAQSQNADKPIAPRGRATQHQRDTMKTN